ncbi:hypothetical protein [Kitasatospora sp. NPDC093558]|uniref:hypothetical protein n=1 Tax=Kitasatospora sp. NPDC093558 TaxID=3155201 RepID=UPI0034176185
MRKQLIAILVACACVLVLAQLLPWAAAMRGTSRSAVTQTAPPPPIAPGTAEDSVSTCRVGAYLSDVYDVLPASSAFSARVWVWSLCPTKDLDPLPLASFPNSDSPRISSSQVTMAAGLSYHIQLIEGTFRQSFDETNYPFDHQHLVMLMTAPQDARHFLFTPDTVASSMAQGIDVSGWRIDDFKVTSYVQDYTTNFGDPTLAPKAPSQYSRMRLDIGLVRADPINFLKVVAPLFLIFFVISLTFAIGSTGAERFGARFATLGATLFAVLVNMDRADITAPGRRLTMVDELHILTLAWVMVAFALTAVLWRWTTAGKEAVRIERMNVVGGSVGSLAYMIVAVILIVRAAMVG